MEALKGPGPSRWWGVQYTRRSGNRTIETRTFWNRERARKEAAELRKTGYLDAHVVRADMSEWRPDR